jgi:hypothetical protein
MLLLAGPLVVAGFFPLPYVQPVFRPPAEADSLILQVTTGCSWNKCSFCEMYQQPQQAYKVKPIDELLSDLKLASSLQSAYGPVRRIFLADGDAMGLPTKRLAEILQLIQAHMPDCKRVSSYCLPRNVRGKSVEELQSLQALGLRTMYVGCESGDDEVLRRIGKGETQDSSVDALLKLDAAGLKTSVMILHGLAGRQLSEQHVLGSAELVRRAPPTYLSTLVVSFPLETSLDRHAAGFSDLEGGGFVELTNSEVVTEQRALLEAIGPDLSKKVIFRSDHASNYLPLKGTLPKDRDRLLALLEKAEQGRVRLRPEWARGL